MPVKETDDPTLAKGKRVTDEFGAPPRQTSVHRLVYDANGKLLYDNTWRSYYVGRALARPRRDEGAAEEARQAKKPGAGDPATTTPADADGTATGPTTTAIRRSRLPSQP